MKDKDLIKRIKSDCNNAKNQLMKIQDNLEEIGAVKESNELRKIIIKLEIWQNK